MYGVVLMAALATSSSAPDFGHCGCCGWGGGYGGWGGGYGGCFGCYGGYGGYTYGWCGGCYGCWGGSPYQVWGCYGGYGGYYGYGCTGCYGCYGGYSGYGIPVPGGPTYVGPGMTNPTPPPSSTPPAEVTPAPKKTGTEQARARVRIELPADAKLYVDGVLTKTGSAVRVFQTPELSANQTYFYELRAEVVRNGQTLTESRQLLVRPGNIATASFAGLEQQAAAASTAPVPTATTATATESTAQR